MTEVININVGETGTRIAEHFWKTLVKQHGVDRPQQEGRMTFFKQIQNKWQARSIFVDFDTKATNSLKNESKGLHNHKNIIAEHLLSAGNFGQAYYNCYPQLKEQITDCIRKNIEQCNRFSGFICNSNMADSVGSGAGSGVMEVARQRYPDKIMQNFKIVPLVNEYAHPIEIYNATFAFHREVQLSDISLFCDNSAIHWQLAKQGNFRPSSNEVNKWIGQAIAQTTIPFRYSGQLNTSQRKIATNLIMFPRMHFFTFAVNTKNETDTIASAIHPDNYLLSRYYTASPQLKTFNLHINASDGLSSENEVVNKVKSEFDRRNYKFIDWIQDPIHVSLSPMVGERESAFSFANGYHIMPYYKKIGEMFTVSFRRKAFIYRYLSAGMDEMEFTQAESNLNDLCSEYTPNNYEYDEYEQQIQVQDI